MQISHALSFLKPPGEQEIRQVMWGRYQQVSHKNGAPSNTTEDSNTRVTLINFYEIKLKVQARCNYQKGFN